jgi:D-alanyl-D-alanine dipeptidase
MMNLVYTEDHGIPGINYYWVRNEMYNLTHDELRSVGVVDGRSQVSEEIIEPLKRADASLREYGYSLTTKDGYRSADLYRLVYEKRVAKYGKEETDKILNVVTMPHASGKVVDVALLNVTDGKEVMMRKKEDGTDAFFVDFYRSKSDKQSVEYQRLQDLLFKVMTDQGFVLGSKKEYWHFELR